MASSSTSYNIQKSSFTYDVFLSFRGKDTRRTFVDHLYLALQQKSIHTFKDDERIEKGKRISRELIDAIEDSRFYIIVFSKNYASSSWCLNELVKIMECQKMTQHTAYPVFYDVEPSEVRTQSGAVGEAFAKHKKKKATEKWREALKQAANLSGFGLKNTADGHEAKFIQKIVEGISLELRSINFCVDEKLIGMGTRIRDVVSSLDLESADVRMIGIKGIGGGGKTTLARAVFDQISICFQGKSFVENVREVSKASLFGLKLLQKQVLSDVLNDQGITISNVFEGKNMMKKVMCGRKVLLVLDDVDHIDQLDALAGEPKWFKPGSRIIITTRDEQVLVARVNLIRDINLLSNREAICLLSRYAFGREIPIQGYEELSGQVVRYAAGLPLTIRVLGSFLCGKNELEWKDALERLKTIPLKETLEKLKLSYISLEEDYKEIFLDAACILKDWGKDEAIRVLESCGFHARNGLKVLEQKSLITIFKSGRLGMHDHIEEMGRNIVRCLHPDEPYRHSRLWIDEEIKDVLANDLGTNEETKCIKLKLGQLDPEFVMKGLGNMKKLRFLHMSSHADERSSWEFDEVSQYFPNALRYLSWGYYPFCSLPNTFQANILVTLELRHNKIVQLWKGEERKVLHKLRFLDLSYSKLKTFDLGLTPNLETLILDHCENLIEIHISIPCLKLISFKVTFSKLRTLNLRPTPNLKTLYVKKATDSLQLHMPVECLKLKYIYLRRVKWMTPDLRHTPNLETLKLVDCVDLVELLMPVECPKLISLELTHFELRTLDLGLIPNLKTLYVQKWNDFVELNIPVECLKLEYLNLRCVKWMTLDLGRTPNLKTLELVNCVDLVELHMPVERPKLISLELTHSKLRTLDLRRIPNLEKLSLRRCHDLVELQMPIECLNLITLDLSHSKVRTLDLGPTPNLKNLYLRNCYHLVELHVPVGGLKNLSILGLSGCFGFTSFDYTKKFRCFKFGYLEVGSLAEFHLRAELLDICPLHSKCTFPKFQFTCFFEEVVPSLIGNPENTSIGLRACANLISLSRRICGLQCVTKLTLEFSIQEAPKYLDRIECLEKLSLSFTDIKHLPDSICMLRHLKILRLEDCKLLEKLSEDLGQLECLEVLWLQGCTSLQGIPNNICNMKRLEYLNLNGCILVENLPEELGCIECLQDLDIEGTSVRHLPFSIVLLEGLHIKGSTLLHQSCTFSRDREESVYDTFYHRGTQSKSLLRDPDLWLRRTTIELDTNAMRRDANFFCKSKVNYYTDNLDSTEQHVMGHFKADIAIEASGKVSNTPLA
ncbi:TMV resistance protein N-like [Cynara cardunculus var. scolymus]|uniref:TMV resistance protein N-like n=1 Tax=Cynara cardunculus var. scolymus TaxID=59895 RepID=UPI000D62B203|nr:TMV resistance protein N-like [Cynara cardunculus var. scolymus]